MKFEVDLNKLSDDKLELILDMKKKGIIRRVNNDIDKPVKTKREIMLDELEGKKPSAYSKNVSKYIPVSDDNRKRKLMNFNEIAKKMANIVRTSKKEWGLKELISKALPHRKSIGGSDYSTLRPLLEKHLYGIRIIKVGRTVRRYAPSSIVKDKSKMNISEDRRMYMSNRGKYTTSMAKKLRAENPHLEYSEALRRAQINFNETQQAYKKKEAVKEQVTVTDKIFPDMGVGSNPKILKDIILNVIQKRGELMYKECSYPLALKLSEWRDFCSKIMINSIKIAEYFGVPNRFSLKTYGNDIVVVYS